MGGLARANPRGLKPAPLNKSGIIRYVQKFPVRAGLFFLAALVLLNLNNARLSAAPSQGNSSNKSQKLPRPIPLGRDLSLERDAASGELRATAKSSLPAPPPANAIRSHVTLVQVPCTVTAPDGTQVRGLSQNDFHLSEDSAA